MSQSVEEHSGAASDAAPFYNGVGPATRWIDRIIAAFENLAMWGAAGAVLIMVAITTVSVAGRELFGAPIPDDVIFQGLLMVATIALPLAFVHRRDGHISVTITTNWLPPRMLASLRLFGNVIGLIFFIFVWWGVAKEVSPDLTNEAVYDGVFELPTWPMKAVFSVAVMIFLVRIVFSIIQCVMDILSGENRSTET